jgi:hypothetical protein
VAANLCLAVATVHRVDAVIGDFQERNILVSDTTRVTLVDCDSMQFTDADGHQFLCGVGRPEFTAPELAGANLSTTAREKPSDLFALAVHIHLLLMAGNHPFLRGEWIGDGDQPDAMTLAKSGQWAGGLRSALRTHPLAPSVAFLPPDIQRLFIRAFTEGARNPAVRPSAAEWLHALQAISIGTCPRGHQIPAEALHCPWCAIDDERAKRRSQRAQTNSAPAPSTPPASVTNDEFANRNLFLALAAFAGIALVILVGFVINQVSRSSHTASTPYTSTYTSAYSPTTSTYTPTYISTYRPAHPPTVSSTYPPPNAQSFDSVYQNAKVGECVNRALGAERSDGSLTITSLYLTDCGAPDATDKVVKRTNDISDCANGGGWVRSGSTPPIVLCLGRI